MQDINIAEQMVNRGFAKWAEHTADPVQQISLHQSNVRSGENALMYMHANSRVLELGQTNLICCCSDIMR